MTACQPEDSIDRFAHYTVSGFWVPADSNEDSRPWGRCLSASVSEAAERPPLRGRKRGTKGAPVLSKSALWILVATQALSYPCKTSNLTQILDPTPPG
jgi:hypothetical protein